MLRELENIRQIEGEDTRRWFSDELFELIVWFDENSMISGFQLCYKTENGENAFTWTMGESASHRKIDSGDNPGFIKMTPLLSEHIPLKKYDVMEKFKEAAEFIEQDIRNVVVEKLENFPEKGTDHDE